MDIFLIQFTLGVLLFFIINWIGKHSYSIGYMEISVFVKAEESPAFNFLVRVLTPVIFIIVISTIFYHSNLDKYVWKIYLVNIYYITFRLVFNLVTNRGLLMNWYRQLLYWIAIIIISFYTYEKLIKVKANILPDFTTISNELWIIILVFLFQISNNLRFSNDATQKRKDNYLTERYNNFKALYGTLIKDLTKNQVLESIVYAILIYEDFNRPRIARLIENIKFIITKKPHTLGVMQVRTTRVINDKESVKLGVKKIIDAYEKYLVNNPPGEGNEYYDWSAINYIIEDYNKSTSYSIEINELHSILKNKFYENTTDTLNPLSRIVNH